MFEAMVGQTQEHVHVFEILIKQHVQLFGVMITTFVCWRNDQQNMFACKELSCLDVNALQVTCYT